MSGDSRGCGEFSFSICHLTFSICQLVQLFFCRLFLRVRGKQQLLKQQLLNQQLLKQQLLKQQLLLRMAIRAILKMTNGK
jgi:hypothetical protein